MYNDYVKSCCAPVPGCFCRKEPGWLLTTERTEKSVFYMKIMKGRKKGFLNF